MSHRDKIHVVSRAVIVDQGHLLVCKTLDLPTSFYFLPGGHVEHGESAQSCLLRELTEETGTACTIKRFLGCLEYSFELGYSSICHSHEYNLIFEVESKDLKVNKLLHQLENQIQLLWLPWKEINNEDFRAEPLKRLLPEWLNQNLKAAFESEMI